MRRCSIVRLFGCLIASLALSLTANAADKVQVRVPAGLVDFEIIKIEI